MYSDLDKEFIHLIYRTDYSLASLELILALMMTQNSPVKTFTVSIHFICSSYRIQLIMREYYSSLVIQLI